MLFLVASVAWIVVTDSVVQSVAGDGDPASVSLFQSIKGLLYVLGTTGILLGLLTLRERRASSAEERERRRFTMMADAGLIGMHLWREDGTVLQPNDRYLRTLGLSRDELERHGINWREVTAPEDRDRDQSAVEEIQKHGECRPFEKEILRKDGSRARVVTWGARINNSDDRIAMILDVTNLSVARRDFQTIFEHATDGILVMGPDDRFLDVNPAMAQMLGCEQRELSGLSFQEIVAESHVAEAEALRAELNSHAHIRGRIDLKHRSGSSVPVEFTATRLPDGKYISIVRDRSEEARREAELERVARQLREAQRIGNVGSWESNLETDELELSDEALRAFGHERASFTGRRSWFYNILHPQDAERVREAVNKAIQSQETLEVEHRVMLPDGSARWLLSHARVRRDANGKPVRLLGVSRNIHERKLAEQRLRESEDRYRKLIHYSNDAVLLSSPEGGIQFSSPSIERILGYTPEEFSALDMTALIHADDQPKFNALQARVPAVDGVVFRSLHRVRHKQGHWVWVEHTMTSWLNDPSIQAIVANVHDVTERMSLQEQLNHASKMDGIGRLAGGVAHDFNNLLTAISGYAQLLEARLEEDSVAVAQTERIMEAASRASELTRRLLAFSRRQMLQPRIIDLNARVRDMEALLKHIIGEHIKLEIKPAGHLPPICADPSQIDQVILNLAVNARDAMPKGGRLCIETSEVFLDAEYAGAHPEVTPGHYAQLTVSDTGMGMDAETRKRAFEPFFTTKGAGEGTGLGLAMVYGIVRQSEGHIWLYSEPGRGTVFKIYLPISGGEVEASQSPPESALVAGNETVLVVEDEDSVRTLVCEVLNMHGYKVLSARNGAEALAELNGVSLDLMLTDVVMPGMDGRELADAVRAAVPAVRVIFMSGYTDDAIVEDGKVVEGVQFLQKPFSPTALLHRVREVLDRQ